MSNSTILNVIRYSTAVTILKKIGIKIGSKPDPSGNNLDSSDIDNRTIGTRKLEKAMLKQPTQPTQSTQPTQPTQAYSH